MGLSVHAEEPGKKPSRGEEVETLKTIEVVIKVPKPEAQIFTPKMKTQYQLGAPVQSFLDLIQGSVKKDF